MSSPVLAITASRSGPRWSSIPRASLAPPVPPDRRTITTPAASSPVIRMPECFTLWRLLIEISSGVSCSMMRAISRSPQSTGRRPGIRRDQRRRVVLGLAVVARDQHVLVHLACGIGQRRRADRVERRHDGDAARRHLGGLLRRPTPATRRACASRGRRSRPPAARSRRPESSAARARSAGCSGSRTGRGTARPARRCATASPPPRSPCPRPRRRRRRLPSPARALARPPRRARPASREPITIGTPAIAQRSASPKPSAPVPPTTATVPRACAMSSARAIGRGRLLRFVQVPLEPAKAAAALLRSHTTHRTWEVRDAPVRSGQAQRPERERLDVERRAARLQRELG